MEFRTKCFGSFVIFTLFWGSSLVSAWTLWAAPPTNADCTSPDPFADTENCTCYYLCFRIGSTWTLTHQSCATGGMWDQMSKSCVAGECEQPTVPTSPPSTTTQTTKSPSTITAAPSSSVLPVITTPTTITTIKEPTVVPPTQTPTQPPLNPIICSNKGFIPHPANCQAYYLCVINRGKFYAYPFLCQRGTYFRASYNRCVVGTCAPNNPHILQNPMIE